MNNWYTLLPKVELHIHLEGAIPFSVLLQLIKKYSGQDISQEELQKKFQYQDFPHFLEIWDWKNNFLREYEDFTLIAEAFAKCLAKQNIHYAEVFFSPSDFKQHNLLAQELVIAVSTGLQKVSEVEIALIVDLVRDNAPKQAERTFAEINEVREHGIIGIGIGGSEHMFPPEFFSSIYKQARKLGYHTTAHAGEAAGAQSIWSAINNLHVERIGHGTRAIEDPSLITYLIQKQIPLEMCPYSNVCTGVVETIEEHPIRTLFHKGVLVTLNTDDPLMFGNSLAQEYALLVEKLGFTKHEIQQLILNGISASWLSDNRKKELSLRFQNDPAWNLPVNMKI